MISRKFIFLTWWIPFFFIFTNQVNAQESVVRSYGTVELSNIEIEDIQPSPPIGEMKNEEDKKKDSRDNLPQLGYTTQPFPILGLFFFSLFMLIIIKKKERNTNEN